MDDQNTPDIPEQVQENLLKRVVMILTKEDMETLQQLDTQDPSGNASQYFLMSKVPNFEAILKEEMDAYAAKQA